MPLQIKGSPQKHSASRSVPGLSLQNLGLGTATAAIIMSRIQFVD